MITKLDTSTLSLLERADYLTSNKKVWSDEAPTAEQNWFERDKPYEYLNLQLDILDKICGNVIVEIGSARQPMNHPLDEIVPMCCTDGHSTFFWANSQKETYTVDIANYGNILHGIKQQHPDTFNAYMGDGITFLDHFERKIDLLFLDAWDVEPGTQYAENHLKAFNSAKDKLSDRHIIGIDDTDVFQGGKGRLIIPELQKLNYHMVTDGRQTIFTNFDLKEVD